MSRPDSGPELLQLHIDGASRGNPGEAGFGVFATDAKGVAVASLYGYIGRATNNVAEYQALIHALRYAHARGAKRVFVRSDSQLVVRQMAGEYKVKHPDMQALHREAKALFDQFGEARIAHVPREENREADRLANRALDLKASKLD